MTVLITYILACALAFVGGAAAWLCWRVWRLEGDLEFYKRHAASMSGRRGKERNLR